MVLLNTVGGVFAYTYTESFAGVSGPSEWTNLSRGFDVDYVSGGSVNYSVISVNGSFSVGNESFTKRKLLTLNLTSDNLTNYQVPKTILYDDDMQPNMSDIRFTYYKNNTLIPYWSESVNNSNSSDVVLKISQTSTSETTKIWQYYGNSNVISNSSGADTFIVFDDFSTDQLGSYWTEDHTSFSVSSGKLATDVNSWLNLKHATGLTSDDDWRIYTRMKVSSAGGSCVVGVGTETGHNYLIGDWGGTWGIAALLGSSDVWEYKRFASGTGYVLDSDTALDDTYHDVSISKAGTTYKVYLDDVEQDSETITAGTPSYLHLESYDYGRWDYVYMSKYTSIGPTWLTDGAEQSAFVPTTIFSHPQSGANGTAANISETNTSAVSTLNLGGLTILQNIENLFNNTATVDYANYTINYTAHAVLRSPVNASSFYGSATLEWYTNPQGTSATYYVAEDPDFFTSVAQGTTTQENTTLALSPDTYYWKVKVGAVESDVWQFTINETPPVAGLFNFSVYDESTFAALSSFDVKIYNDTWYNEKSTSTGSLVFNSSEVVAGEYTALINASGYSPRWRIVESPANVSAYLPNTTNQIWLINFNLIDYTNLFSYSTSRLILTKPTTDLGTITVSDSYFDASGSNPVYLIDYNNYILTLRNSAGYEKSVGSYLPIQDTQTSLVVGEITTLPDTEAHGGFAWNITKSNASIVLMWDAPEGSLTEAFQYNVTNSTSGAVEYEINTIAPYGTATFYIPAESDTVWLIQLSASTSDGAVYHKESYRVSQQMIDFELSDYWYNVYSMFLLLILGLVFGYRNARTGAVLVSLSAAALAIMGLLHVPASVLAMAVTISIFSKMAEGKK